jgi:DNA-binding FrmR family transcriptional regulator
MSCCKPLRAKERLVIEDHAHHCMEEAFLSGDGEE